MNSYRGLSPPQSEQTYRSLLSYDHAARQDGVASTLTFSEEKIVEILREADRVPVAEVSKKHGVSGARQASCRVVHTAAGFMSSSHPDAMLTTASRSGFKATAWMGSQLRVCRDQRAGLRSRAWRYNA